MGHPENAKEFTRDSERTHWHDQALWFVREKRDKAAKSVPEWEELREQAAKIKLHTMAHLDRYLEEFEANAKGKGIHVHWAEDAQAHNQIVLKILQDHQITRLVKSKSMLTEECGLNPVLEENGIEVVDTDLGERIVQLRHEHPSHIVLPAIHLKKEDVSATFHEHLHTEEGNNDPTYLTRAARAHLREKFLAGEAGLTGVNFGISETGGVVICTNEGNADLGACLPKLHIASMGIEKMLPRLKDLAVFTRLLARSATGQPITTYTSHYHGPVEGGEMHIILVDNGRSTLLGNPTYRKALNCIRCGACINTCPVYRRSGGHSYGYTIPGPIGSILGAFKDRKANRTLPYASTLCGSCTCVCPVKIDLHQQLYYHRQDIVNAGLMDRQKETALNLAGWLFKHPKLLAVGGKVFRMLVPRLPRSLVYNRFNPWGESRELPEMPAKSFKEIYRERKGGRP